MTSATVSVLLLLTLSAPSEVRAVRSSAVKVSAEVKEDPESVLFWPAPTTLVRPVQTNGQISAVELRVAPGAGVRSATEGRVVSITQDRLAHKTVTLQHDDRYTTAYGHLAVVLVTVGETVSSGQVLGHAGLSDNPKHGKVHFEVHDMGISKNPLDFRWRSVAPAPQTSDKS
jgi:murein DD-endopeptidase MepM/ murein hydrolase activator NlpD